MSAVECRTEEQLLQRTADLPVSPKGLDNAASAARLYFEQAESIGKSNKPPESKHAMISRFYASVSYLQMCFAG